MTAPASQSSWWGLEIGHVHHQTQCLAHSSGSKGQFSFVCVVESQRGSVILHPCLRLIKSLSLHPLPKCPLWAWVPLLWACPSMLFQFAFELWRMKYGCFGYVVGLSPGPLAFCWVTLSVDNLEEWWPVGRGLAGEGVLAVLRELKGCWGGKGSSLTL